MPHHAPQQRQCVPACLGTRCSRCGCCRCHRGKWKRHSSMTLLHKTVQDCTTKAVQHALATLRLLFRACSSSPPTLTSLDLFPSRSMPQQPFLPATCRNCEHMFGSLWLLICSSKLHSWPQSRRNCGGHTLFFWVKYCSSKEACLLLAKSSSSCGWLCWVGSQKVKICYSNHTRTINGLRAIQLRLTLHNATIEWGCLIKRFSWHNSC